MKTLQHKFVDFIPIQLEENILYVTMQYKTVVHLCPCGCGNKVITPITPTDWKLSFDGQSISLNPSIGSWNFPCRSHYWIIENQVVPSSSWTNKMIQEGREEDAKRKEDYFEQRRKLD